jgi:hypothetical protein
MIDYLLAREATDKEEVTLEFLDAAGKSIRTLSSKPEAASDEATLSPRLPVKAGLNRFVWDLRYPDASRFKGMILWGGSVQGPEVVPGHYQVRLTSGGKSQTQGFEVRKDPRVAATAADYQKKFDFLQQLHDKLTETHDAIARIRDARDQVNAVAERAKPVAKDTTLSLAAKALGEKLTKVEEALYQTKNKSSQDPLNYPIRLNNKLAALTGVVDGVDAPPTDQAVVVYQDIASRIDAELTTLRKLLSVELAEFNQLVRAQEIPAVIVKDKKKDDKPAVHPIP